MAQSNALIFYDISSPLQPRSYAPNPSKTRLALSFKRVPFKTTWIDIVNIPTTRNQLACAAVRKLDDGSDYPTLPILQNPASGEVIGDSFDIANYLDATFPDSGARLFPGDAKGIGLDYESPNRDRAFFAPLTVRGDVENPAYEKFNVHVDATFSAHIVPFAQFLPFNPETAEEVKAIMAERAHLGSWDDICIPEEARKPLMEAFEVGLESLARLFLVNEEGPFLEGEEASYADLIVGGWVNMLSVIMPGGEWREFRTWYGGVFARLHDALQERYWICE